MKIESSGFVYFINTSPSAGLDIVFLFGNRNPGPLCETLNCFRESQLIDFHDEINNASAFAASKTIINLFIGRHGKTRRFFVVKGTETEVIGSAPLSERNIFRNDVDNIIPVGEFRQKGFREHFTSPSKQRE